MVSAEMFTWVFLFAVVANAAPLSPPTYLTQCDGVNCFVNIAPSSGEHDWTAEQLAAAPTANLLKLEVDVQSKFTLIVADCKDPVNASSCLKQGLPCAGMGRSFFFSPAIHAMASCSGSFITEDTVLTAGHCCMELPGVWNGNIIFYLNYDNGASTGTYVPTQMIVPQPWNSSSDRTYDWCFMKMNGSAPSHLKTSYSFQPSRFTNGFSSYGWPAIPPYDGSWLYQATGQCRGTSPKWPPSSYDACDHMPTNQGMMYMTCNTM